MIITPATFYRTANRAKSFIFLAIRANERSLFCGLINNLKGFGYVRRPFEPDMGWEENQTDSDLPEVALSGCA